MNINIPITAFVASIYQVFCPVCFRKFEALTLKEAIAKSDTHEKEEHTENTKCQI